MAKPTLRLIHTLTYTWQTATPAGTVTIAIFKWAFFQFFPLGISDLVSLNRFETAL